MQTLNPAQHKAIRVESGQLKKRPRAVLEHRDPQGLADYLRGVDW